MNTANPPAITRPRPYRRFLTSAFHTRFVNAAILSSVIALNTSFWLGPKNDFFWSWFPFGPAGFKALLFFMTSLFVFILLIATLRIGRPTPRSPFVQMWTTFVSLDALQVLIWYSISAWWFSEAYIWSSNNLGWVTRGTLTTPDRLNERPIYSRAYFLMLALAQAGAHLYQSHSSLHIPILPAPTPQTKDVRTHPAQTIQSQLQNQMPQVLTQAATLAAVTTVIGPFIYTPFLRTTFWQAHLLFAKPFFNLSRVNAHPSGFPPLGIPFIFRTFFAGFLLSSTWGLTWLLFMTYLKQEPTKKGLPLSSTSRDPNGTMLNGLKAKRDIVKTFAFWELAIIAQRYPDRRKAIFSDIERPTGPIWGQMLQAALTVLRESDARVVSALISPASADVSQKQELLILPRIIPEAKKQSMFAPVPPPSTTGQMVKDFVTQKALKSLGNSPRPWHPSLQDATRLLEYPQKPNQAQGQAPDGLGQYFNLNSSRISWLFGTTNTALINSSVLGTPSGNAALVVDTVEAMTKMLVASLTEDNFGKAAAGVPETVKTMTILIQRIETFVKQHSADVGGGIDEVEIIVSRLKASLRELLSAFQMFLTDVGLAAADLAEAKTASEPSALLPKQDSRPPSYEMAQVKESEEEPVRRQLFPQNKSTESKSRRQSETSKASDSHRPLLEAPRRESVKANGTLRQRNPVPVSSGGR